MSTESSTANHQLKPADPGLSAAVAASAGTGKTFLLVTRIIRLLLSGARPEGILALTFTRKAAAEMRDRLFDRLSELALLDDTKLLNALAEIGLAAPEKHLNQAQQLFELLLFADQRPRITTFHAFCQELLLRFPLEADVPAGYELLETTAVTEQMAWDALCLEATRNPDGKTGAALTTLFAACGGLDNSRDALVSGFLGHRSDWWAYTEKVRDPVEFAIGRLREKLNPQQQPLRDFFNLTSCDALIRYTDLLERHAIKTNLDRCKIIRHSLQQARSLQERFKLVQKAFLTTTGQVRSLKASKPLESKLGIDGQEVLLSLHQILCDQVLEALDQCRRLASFELNSAWYLAGQHLLDHYQSIKQKLGVLDFADLEWRSYQLLHTSEQALWVQYKLDQKIDHLLLDEFQDTNPTQWQLILPLLEEMASSTSEHLRSVFLVGDSKQSIYSFRRANPGLQNTASNWLRQNLDADLFPLSKSWRSAPAIIDFLNAVFAQSDHSLLPDYQMHATHKEDLWGEVLLLPAIINETQADEDIQTLRDPLTQPRLIPKNDAHYQEGLQIADTLLNLLSEQRLIPKQSQAQVLDYDDIIILLRNRTHAAHYEQALLEKEIPFIGIEKGGLLECLEVQDIEALLNVLITPFSNLSLAQVLRSPIIGATDFDLQSLAIESTHSWYEKLLTLATFENCSPALMRAARLLHQWRILVRRLPVHDLLDRIYFEGDIINRYSQAAASMSQSSIIANLQQVLDMALQIDSGRYPSVMRFLQQLKKLRTSSREAPDTPSTTQTTAKVRLMTIHAAKGLEAPVIFLADCGSVINNKDTYNAIVDWPADKTSPHLIMLASRKDESPQLLTNLRLRLSEARAVEDANLLYVAISRARHMLVISAASNKENALEKSWYSVLEKSVGQLSTKRENNSYCLLTGSLSYADSSSISMKNDAITETPISPPPNTFGQIKSTISPSENTTQPENNGEQKNALNRFDAQRYGILLHKAIECLSAPDIRNLSELADATIKQKDFDKIASEANKIVNNPSFAFLFNPDKYENAYKELPITYSSESNDIVQGVIDRLVLNESEAWIIDFKSSEYALDINALALSYKNQLDYYATGIKKIWPKRKIRKAILFTNIEELVELN